MKSSSAPSTSLLHYLALWAQTLDAQNTQDTQKLLGFWESWLGVWGAAELSFTQISQDLGSLEREVTQMNAEFVKVRDQRESRGLDNLIEDAKGQSVAHFLSLSLHVYSLYVTLYFIFLFCFLSLFLHDMCLCTQVKLVSAPVLI